MADKKTINGADRWATITASDTVNILEVPRAIQVNVAGNVALVGADDVVAVLTVAAGVPLAYQPKRINATNTTATGLIALY